MVETSKSTTASPTRSLERSKDLVVAAVYTREVGASLERVWENVHDWEHLPWLHSDAFRSIEKIDSGAWGWFARIGLQAGDRTEIELELITDESELRYVSRTLTEAGAASEIWTFLDPISDVATKIRVEFCVPPTTESSLHRIGKGYVSLYTLLWNEDEEMMRTRTAALAADSTDRSRLGEGVPLSLGALETFREKLPWVVEFSGERFRIVEVDGRFFAHGIQCPHLRGPLDEAEVVDGEILCPWHGYGFDVRTGKSCDGRGLRLLAAPSVEVEAGEVFLRNSRIGSTGK